MAHVTKLFFGFEESNVGYNTRGVGNHPTTNAWSLWAKPPRVYHRNGVATLDPTIDGTVTPGLGVFFHSGRVTTVLPEAYKTGNSIGGYSGIVTTARTNYINATTGGMQIAVDRDYWIGASATEIYAQWDFRVLSTLPTTTNTVFNKTTAMFQWGDVGIHIKSNTYVATPSPMQTLTLAVYNNGAEIATISLPQQSEANWYYCRAHVKLDGAAGVIEFDCNTITQSVPFAAGNTVNTVSVADADWIYIGPPYTDSGTTGYVHYLDNVWIGTTGWPSGRPRGFLHTMSTDGTLSGWAAEGSGATTVVAALQTNTGPDGVAARGSGAGASALLNLSSISAVGLEAELIGYTIIPTYISNRDQTTWKRLSVGVSNGGTHTMGAYTSALQPPMAYNLTPPAEVYIPWVWEAFYLDSGGSAFTVASLHSVRLLTI